MNTSAIQKPRIPETLTAASFDEGLMQDDRLEMCLIEDCSIIGEDIERICADQVVFRNVAFIDVSFRNIELTDVLFEKCDLSNADFSGAIIHRTEWGQSKLLGINLAEATMRNVLFSQCPANFSSFLFSNMKQVRFDQCSLLQCECNDAVLQHTHFDSCDLEGANFIGTSLQKMDLSSCRFEQIHVSLEKLKGCKITPQQATVFARALGAVIT
ncbi:pentapeptide repeat-containing protein [Bacillus atrophaeus]|nr:pentapeptide repeat-containing protein [Bacillus atrophaeus]